DTHRIWVGNGHPPISPYLCLGSHSQSSRSHSRSHIHHSILCLPRIEFVQGFILVSEGNDLRRICEGNDLAAAISIGVTTVGLRRAKNTVDEFEERTQSTIELSFERVGRRQSSIFFSSFFAANNQICPTSGAIDSKMGTREVYEEKLRSGNLYHDPTMNPGLGSPRCPRCLSLLNPNVDNGEWTITSVLHDATAVDTFLLLIGSVVHPCFLILECNCVPCFLVLITLQWLDLLGRIAQPLSKLGCYVDDVCSRCTLREWDWKWSEQWLISCIWWDEDPIVYMYSRGICWLLFKFLFYPILHGLFKINQIPVSDTRHSDKDIGHILTLFCILYALSVKKILQYMIRYTIQKNKQRIRFLCSILLIMINFLMDLNFIFVKAGSGIGGMLSAIHGFNTGIPYFQKHVKGPKWLPFLIGSLSFYLWPSISDICLFTCLVLFCGSSLSHSNRIVFSLPFVPLFLGQLPPLLMFSAASVAFGEPIVMSSRLGSMDTVTDTEMGCRYDDTTKPKKVRYKYGYALPKFAQLTVTSYYAASSASHYGISLLTRHIEDSYTYHVQQKRLR
ncbi:hypothetical protein HYC85_003739, partial [Camellia sinensis]